MLRILSLLFLSLATLPAATILINAPSPGVQIEPGTPATFTFSIDNSDPFNPEAALWLLVTSIEIEVFGPSLLADFTYTDPVSGIIDGVPFLIPLPPSLVLIGPSGSLSPLDLLFLSGFSLEPLITATAGFYDVRFTFNYDYFVTDPYDPFADEIIGLADGSNSVVLPLFQVEVLGSAVPEPSTFALAGLALAALAVRRRLQRR